MFPNDDHLVFLEYGVFATRKCEKGDFLLEYHGTLYTEMPELACDKYLYEFQHGRQTYWYDSAIGLTCTSLSDVIL